MMLEIEVPEPAKARSKHTPYPVEVQRVRAAFPDRFAFAEDTEEGKGKIGPAWRVVGSDHYCICWIIGGKIFEYDSDFRPQDAKSWHCLGVYKELVEKHSTAHERTQWMLEFCEKHDKSLWPEAWRKEMENG